MTLDTLFSISYLLAAPAWTLLILAPRWKWTQKLTGSMAISAVLSAIYLALAVLYFRNAEGGFGSLDEVALLFQSRGVLLAGWIHYLAFDLLVGSWEVRDSQRLGINHALVIPCLIVTLLVGPIGFLMYLVLRWALKGAFLAYAED